MSGGPDEDAEKSFDASAQKLLRAREKGEVARSADLAVTASYVGFVLAVLATGGMMIDRAGTAMVVLLDQADTLSQLVFVGPAQAPMGGILREVVVATLPLFAAPALAIVLAVLAQRAFVFAPAKLEPKLSRISLIANARNKFGRAGLFEFFKSFAKLVIYSVCVAWFIRAHLGDMAASLTTGPAIAASFMVELCLKFLFLVVLVSGAIGVLDAVFQHNEHLRKNRMSRKEVQDENKNDEGDPYLKAERRHRGQQIAGNRMLSDVPMADVVIVNPTHYAVALKWSRAKGSAPVCVAKGQDEMAAAIREAAQGAGVPIHSDPPTARALYATVEIGGEIPEAQYRPVAAAIRFAEAMRKKARGRG